MYDVFYKDYSRCGSFFERERERQREKERKRERERKREKHFSSWHHIQRLIFRHIISEATMHVAAVSLRERERERENA
jgi:hypothetical protein